MGVLLSEVIEHGGYDLNTVEDARWLLSKRNEWEELVDKAEAMVTEAEEAEQAENEAEYKRTFPDD